MRIGILSDSHSQSRRLKQAVKLLEQADCEVLVHCGDLCNADDVAVLAAFDGPGYLAAGNMDRHDLDDIRQAAEAHGLAFACDFITVDLGDGRYLAAMHGHLDELMDDLIRGGEFAYLCHGHTHKRRDETIKTTRVLNPGALYHPKSGPVKTVLVLDTDLDKVNWLTVV